MPCPRLRDQENELRPKSRCWMQNQAQGGYPACLYGIPGRHNALHPGNHG